MSKIKEVDGFKIRNSIDIDFGVIGDNNIYPYIKKGEIWFDKAFKKEQDFFIKLFNKKKKLIKKFGYEKAKAMLRVKLHDVKTDQIIIRQIKKTNRYSVLLVNGAKVRSLFDPSFCFGGHWLVYDYIPEGQVWLDSVTDKKEQKYVLTHELYEIELMHKGKSYNNAHDYACAAEKEARRSSGVANYLKD